MILFIFYTHACHKKADMCFFHQGRRNEMKALWNRVLFKMKNGSVRLKHMVWVLVVLLAVLLVCRLIFLKDTKQQSIGIEVACELSTSDIAKIGISDYTMSKPSIAVNADGKIPGVVDDWYDNPKDKFNDLVVNSVTARKHYREAMNEYDKRLVQRNRGKVRTENREDYITSSWNSMLVLQEVKDRTKTHDGGLCK